MNGYHTAILSGRQNYPVHVLKFSGPLKARAKAKLPHVPTYASKRKARQACDHHLKEQPCRCYITSLILPCRILFTHLQLVGVYWVIMTTTMDKNDVVVSFPSTKVTIPGLLLERQLGVSGVSHRAFQTTQIASRVAWNTSRMNNIILAVGPGTPAAVASSSNRSNSNRQQQDSSSSSSEEEEDEDTTMNNNGDEEEDSDAEMENEHEESHLFRRTLNLGAAEHGASDLVERIVLEYLEQNNGDDSSDDDSQDEIVIPRESTPPSYVPSIRHGGCINTAAWLTSPWRLSLADRDGSSAAIAVDSQETPTQLVTSGDDRTVKFWDVRYAMGTANPLPGGKDTQLPFADTLDCEPFDWNGYSPSSNTPLQGSVVPLATVLTGHRGNVFHVTPVNAHPGKVVTCAADGYLRLSDINRPTESSTVIMSPENTLGADDILPMGLFALRASSMCFSHHFLNANTGLLCGEHGLFRFDLRLSPREQSSTSLLGNDETCKSCAIWSELSMDVDVDSAYVFAGGASAEVAMYDLRMTDGSDSRIVQKYRPSGLRANSEVSVSGLDISKDRRELLVSYENDQVSSLWGLHLWNLDAFCRGFSRALSFLAMRLHRSLRFQSFPLRRADDHPLMRWKNMLMHTATTRVKMVRF